MTITVRQYTPADVPQMVEIWNEVVEEGIAFPQLDKLTEQSGQEFFTAQTYNAVAADDDGNIYGLYILHPNNIGRCSHIGNASYAVRSNCRSNGIGRLLVQNCITMAKECGFSLIQFNAVVATNLRARKLYESLGFVPLGTIPHGFLMKDGHYEDICLYYYDLDRNRKG